MRTYDNKWKTTKGARSKKRQDGRAYYKKNKDVYAARHLRNYLSRLGLSLKQYEDLLKEQEGKCAICRRHPTRTRLAVDHCHKTGRVRGLLCNNCNTGLGLLGDQEESVERALSYLKQSKG